MIYFYINKKMFSSIMTTIIITILIAGFIDVLLVSVFNNKELFNMEVLPDNGIDTVEYFNHGIKKIVLYNPNNTNNYFD